MSYKVNACKKTAYKLYTKKGSLKNIHSLPSFAMVSLLVCFINETFQEERIEILTALSQHLNMENGNHDLAIIGEKSEGFSGADLQALLYTTQLMKINQGTGLIFYFLFALF